MCMAGGLHSDDRATNHTHTRATKTKHKHNTHSYIYIYNKQTILAHAAHGVPARALYLFPTKALAQVIYLFICI